MYHFLFRVSTKLFPNAFDITHKIDPDKEQIIDFCPKCNVKLQDKKIITLRKHDQKNHPKTEKELLKRFYTRGMMPMFITIGGVMIMLAVFLGAINITSQAFTESLSVEEAVYIEFCKNLVDEMPQYPEISLYPEIDLFIDRDPTTIQRGEYVLENLSDFEECYYSASFLSLGSKSERLEYFHSSNGEP